MSNGGRHPSTAAAGSGIGVPQTPEDWFEKLYRMLLQAMPCSLLLLDSQLHVVSANPHFYEKAHRNEANTTGASLRDVFPGAIMEFTALETKVRGVFASGQALGGAQLIYRAPGIQSRTYYYKVVPIKAGEVVVNAMLLMDDITEKLQLSESVRLAQRHLTSVVESANDLVVSTDAGGRVVSWNAAAEKVSGFTAEQVRGRLLADLCDVGQRGDMLEVVRRLVAGDSLKSQEFNIVARSASRVPVEWSCSPLRDDDGNVTGVVAVGRDLSERRAFERHIYQTEKLSALGVMAGGIAHEVRNPLSVSYSAAQFLRDPGHEPAFQQECVSAILGGIEQASSIIENLLRFARPSATDVAQPVDLATLVRETIGVVSAQAKLQRIRVLEDYSAAPAPTVGNPQLLKQVIMNIALNAIRAMPNGGDIQARVWRDKDVVVATIADSGEGIAPADLDRIFDPFFTTRPVGQGTGLGLSICDTIVKQHNGTISAASVQGAGSTFTLRLPARPVVH